MNTLVAVGSSDVLGIAICDKLKKMKTKKYKICKICGGHKLPVLGCHCTEAAIRNLKIAQELIALGEIEAACGRINSATEKIKRAAAMPNVDLSHGSETTNKSK